MKLGEDVAPVIDLWLRAEIKDSRDGRNAVLDDFTKTRQNYLLHPNNPQNRDAAKAGGHFKRYEALLTLLNADTLQDDSLVGKLIHFSLMHTSGGFRTECFLRAGSQAEYEALRFGADGSIPRGTSLELPEFATDTLGAEPFEDISGYVEYSQEMNEIWFDARTAVYDWFADHRAQAFTPIQDEEILEATMMCQEVSLTLALSHIAVAASMRGSDYARVPFLAPASITDAAPLGPQYYLGVDNDKLAPLVGRL